MIPGATVNRAGLQDVWLPHLFRPNFQPYVAGKHIVIPEGTSGAVLASNENPWGPAPYAMRVLLADGVERLLERMGLGSRVPEALDILSADGRVFRLLSECLREYVDDYGPFADVYAQHLGHGITGAQIYVAAGGSQLIYKLIRATNPLRGCVMAMMPGFFMYPIGAMAEDRPFYSVVLNDDLTPPLDRFLEEAERVDPSLIFVDTPNNPTGRVVPGDWIKRLVEARLRRHGYVVVDEAYFDFARKGGFTALSLLGRFPNLIVLRSFSKYPALAGGRIGFGIAAPDSEAQRLFPRIKTPFEVATVTVKLAEWSLHPEAQAYLQKRADEIVAERERMARSLAETGKIAVFPSQGNFFLIDVKGTGRTEAQVAEILMRNNLSVRRLPQNPNFVPPSIRERYELLRVTIGTPDQNAQLEEALRRICGAPA